MLDELLDLAEPIHLVWHEDDASSVMKIVALSLGGHFPFLPFSSGPGISASPVPSTLSAP